MLFSLKFPSCIYFKRQALFIKDSPFFFCYMNKKASTFLIVRQICRILLQTFEYTRVYRSSTPKEHKGIQTATELSVVRVESKQMNSGEIPVNFIGGVNNVSHGLKVKYSICEVYL